MSLDPYFCLSDLLSEMQVELGSREWPEDIFERINRAADFRDRLFRAICDYRESWIERVRP